MQVSFHLNGESLGVAFKEVRLFQSHLAYFPAVSLSLGESCTVNLGSAPFRYPVDGFQPLQKAPATHVGEQCRHLLQCTERVAEARSFAPITSAYVFQSKLANFLGYFDPEFFFFM